MALIARAVAFVFLAGALWALLPLVARQRLGLGSAGYGLLGCVGVGAWRRRRSVPRSRRRLAARAIYALACLVVACASVVLALTHSVALAAVALIAAAAPGSPASGC